MKTKSKFIMCIMMLVIIVFSSSIWVYDTVIGTVKRNEEQTITAFKVEQFNTIWSSLQSLILQSEKEVSEISKEIEERILTLSPEKLRQLEYDMTNNVHNDDLHEILMENIEGQSLNGINNHRNGLVVMSSDGYMEDFNYRRANLVPDDHDKSFRLWEESIINSYNKQLDENAIDKLLNRTSGIIALESYDLTKNENHIKIKEMNYESLLEVFLTEGIEGLRNYQIFVPYYITDIGDIFGNSDISQGIKIDNNKIIVVQEFNLYDQIIKSQSDSSYDDQIGHLTNRYDNLLRWLYLFGILLIMSVCAIILYFCTLYNTIVEYEDKHSLHNEKAPTSDEMQKHNSL